MMRDDAKAISMPEIFTAPIKALIVWKNSNVMEIIVTDPRVSTNGNFTCPGFKLGVRQL
jgi:hypothetical protein